MTYSLVTDAWPSSEKLKINECEGILNHLRSCSECNKLFNNINNDNDNYIHNNSKNANTYLIIFIIIILVYLLISD